MLKIYTNDCPAVVCTPSGQSDKDQKCNLVLLAYDTVGSTDRGKFRRSSKSDKYFLPGNTAIKLANPGVIPCSVRLPAHKSPVKPCNIFTVIKILSGKLTTEEEASGSSRTGIPLVRELTGPGHKPVLISGTTETCCIKPCTEINSSGRRFNFDIRYAGTTGSYTVTKTKICPFSGIYKSFDNLLLWSSVTKSTNPCVKSGLIGLTVKESPVKYSNKLLIRCIFI